MTSLKRLDKNFLLEMSDEERSIIFNKVLDNLRNPERYNSESEEAYESVSDIINSERIRVRERFRQHDIKAEIEEFNFLAKVYSFYKKVILEAPERESSKRQVRLFYQNSLS